MKKTARPRWGLVRTHTARALGGGGLESALHLLTLSPTLFQGCIKQLTPESIVDKWDNFALGPCWSAA